MAWKDLADVGRPRVTSKYWKTAEEFRSYLLVKAVIDAARTMSTRMGATVPAGVDPAWNKMFDLSQEIGPTDMDDNTRKMYRAAESRMSLDTSDLRLKGPYKPAEPGEPGKGEPAEKGDSKPMDKEILKTVDDLDKRVHQFQDKKPDMSSGAQKKFHQLMEEILSLMTAVPAMRTASLGDALSSLVKFIRPYMGPFLKEIRKTGLPADARVWNDPDRLQEMIGRMSRPQAEAVLRKTEEILGLLHSLSN
jgi:hypothetical protein